ncbi:phosphodiesterase [Gemmata sp. SH-PL17]|uniref:metallophosphoesterase family protein n=1 Tax=Gemmata sp. SH-PL17 TaxID=1630693 RepID=UPI0004BB4450|nr:metallophosphoesterase family protein [Gemmata sp. SH-PL17]AMV25921.1 phosphodiesterase [Gemmata sp. SH-PL17]
MRLGILSDTHDERERTQIAVGLLREAGAEALIHCGDLASPAIVAAMRVLPSWFVFGNHDSDMVPHLERAATEFGVDCLGWGGVVEVVDVHIGVAHGHMRGDVRRVLATQPDYFLSGHSHIASDVVDGGVRRINPGALHRADAFTVALLDTGNGELQFLRVPK